MSADAEGLRGHGGKERLLRALAELTSVMATRAAPLREAVAGGTLRAQEWEAQVWGMAERVEAEVLGRLGMRPEDLRDAQARFAEDADVVAAARALHEAALPPVEGFDGADEEGVRGEERVASLLRVRADCVVRHMHQVAAEVRGSGREGMAAVRLWRAAWAAREPGALAEGLAEAGAAPAELDEGLARWGERHSVVQAQREAQELLDDQRRRMEVWIFGPPRAAEGEAEERGGDVEAAVAEVRRALESGEAAVDDGVLEALVRNATHEEVQRAADAVMEHVEGRGEDVSAVLQRVQDVEEAADGHIRTMHEIASALRAEGVDGEEGVRRFHEQLSACPFDLSPSADAHPDVHHALRAARRRIQAAQASVALHVAGPVAAAALASARILASE
jgi:hypothetical protein